jgi:hypothetical protein
MARCDQYEKATNALTREAYECESCGILLTRSVYASKIRKRATKLLKQAELMLKRAELIEVQGGVKP